MSWRAEVVQWSATLIEKMSSLDRIDAELSLVLGNMPAREYPNTNASIAAKTCHSQVAGIHSRKEVTRAKVVNEGVSVGFNDASGCGAFR